MQELSPNLTIESHHSEASPPPASSASAWRTLLRSNRAKFVASIAALAVLTIALYAVGRSLSLNEIWGYIQQARLEWIAVAAMLFLFSHVVRITRSVRVLRWEAPAPIRASAQALTGGQVINWLSPIRAGDVWRVWHVGQAGRNSFLWAASSVVLEKGADSLVLAGFAAVLLISPLPQGVSAPLVRLLTTILICMLLFSALSALSSSSLRNRIVALIPGLRAWLNRASLAKVVPARLSLTRRPTRWLELLAYSVMIWVFGLLTNMAVAQAFNIHVNLITHVLLLLTLQTTTILAPVPGNVGVFPLISLSVLSAVGVDADQAVAFGSVLYVLVYGVLLSVSTVVFASSWRLSHKPAPSVNHAAPN
jgi:uncharacterized protein (TIRG00374 family)